MAKLDIKLSKEQIDVVKNINIKNVVVDSVAGSGKTTTNLFIAKTYKKYKILLLTYNSKLKIETREKVNNLGIKNLEVHSYHSYCVKYYNHECFTDYGIIKVLNNNTKLKKKNNKYDIIIVDEAQDMSPLYYELVFKINKDNNKKTTKICIMGDQFQSIYQFNNADSRFIRFAPKLFNFNKYDWIEKKLSTSFRITNNMSQFINKCLIKSDRINANKKGELVRYIICDTYTRSESSRVYQELEYYFNKGYTYDDIFILAPSVRNPKSHIRQLANLLSENGIPIYVPNNDNEKIDQDIIKNKLIFSTFHQVKGLERKVVIVFNFDDSYFTFFDKKNNPYKLPNTIYVAATRAQEKLTVLHNASNDFFKFMDVVNLKNICYFESNNHKIKKIKSDDTKKNISVTELLKFQTSSVIEEALKYINITETKKKDKVISIKSKTKQNNLYENVSTITGISIPAYFEYKNKGTLTIYNELKELGVLNTKNISYCCEDDECLFESDSEDENDSEDESENDEYDSDDEIEEDKDIDIENLTVENLLYISNLWNCYSNGYNYQINQIKNYDWISEDNLNRCIKRLSKKISKDSIFEKKYNFKDTKELMGKELVGYVDCIDNNNYWEFKCVSKLSNEHILQLALYIYLIENSKDDRVIEIFSLLKEIKNNYCIGDNIIYTDYNIIKGKIIKKFKNGNINIETDEGKKHKINKNEIIKEENGEIIFKKEKMQEKYKIFSSNGNTIIIISGIKKLKLDAIDFLMKTSKSEDNILIKELVDKIEIIRLQKKNYYLFNVLDNNILEISASMENLRKMVNILIENKFFKTSIKSDTEFINNNKKLLDKYKHNNRK